MKSHLEHWTLHLFQDKAKSNDGKTRQILLSLKTWSLCVAMLRRRHKKADTKFLLSVLQRTLSYVSTYYITNQNANSICDMKTKKVTRPLIEKDKKT